MRCLSNMRLADMLETRHTMSQAVRAEVSDKSHDWGYRLGSVYIRKVHFRDGDMIRQIEEKVVNRLRQVTSAIRQDGANQVSIITNTAERTAAVEFAKAAAMRPQIVGGRAQPDQRRPRDRGGALRGARESEAARRRGAHHAGPAGQRPARPNARGVDQEREARPSSRHELSALLRASSCSRAGNGRGSSGPLPSGSRRSTPRRRESSATPGSRSSCPRPRTSSSACRRG